ncbi:MAG TPA: class I tRNA ligase family protein [Thermoplasmata archaeon]|nr:class I tRNA ligase family protein [Thermoplasmata archaeon]
MEAARERRWQDAWARAEVARAVRDDAREKFFAIMAYPGSSGFLHVGHVRGLTVADTLHRYHRMRGRRVFFPTGTHASGLPAVTFAQRVKEREPRLVAQLREHGVPESDWTGLEEPAASARFLGRSYLEVARRFGFLVDEGAYLTTIDDDYQAFIRWQFDRLHDRGALVQGPYYASVCPVCGPVSVDPSETDLDRGGDAEVVVYTLVPFRLDDGRSLLAATLRPETVFGVTNVWLAPGTPVAEWVRDDGTKFLVSDPSVDRLLEQHGGTRGDAVEPEALAKLDVSVPLIRKRVPIVLSTIVDPAVGTGAVMSVPGHAPADWIAVGELDVASRERIGAIPEIVELPPDEPLTPSERALQEGTGPPADRACRATGAGQLTDRTALDEATERLYRLEFIHGRMSVPQLGPVPVAEARLATAKQLAAAGDSFELRQFDRPVICRNGHEVVIRRVPDQWFLHYSDAEWKSRARDAAGRMTIVPEEYRAELPGVFDWFQDRPCVRRGRWLGTPFPFDPGTIIEPIADSTFYPAYFVVRRYVADGRLPVAALTNALFDYVFLGEGAGEPSVAKPLQEELRKEFTYWYPLDVNIGGKEHKRVHFPVFIYTHALLLPPDLQPRGIFVNWWLTGPSGEKISKKEVSSKGGRVPPIEAALERWGADALRLFHLTAASPFQDFEWDEAVAEAAAARIDEIERLARAAQNDGAGGTPELDAWLLSSLSRIVGRVNAAMASMDVRITAQAVAVEIPTLVRRYLARGGEAGPGLQRLAGVWVRLLGPVAPHLAEELAEGRGTSLVAVASFPQEDDLPLAPEAEAAEAFLDQVEEDLRGVLRPAEARGEVPDGAIFFVADGWKRTVDGWVREALTRDPKAAPVGAVMERARIHPDLAAYLGAIPRYVGRVAPQVRAGDPLRSAVRDEAGVLRAAEGYLARRFGFSFVTVYAEAEGAPHDPMNRRDRAQPGRPAFYLVPGGVRRARPST